MAWGGSYADWGAKRCLSKKSSISRAGSWNVCSKVISKEPSKPTPKTLPQRGFQSRLTERATKRKLAETLIKTAQQITHTFHSIFIQFSMQLSCSFSRTRCLPTTNSCTGVSTGATDAIPTQSRLMIYSSGASRQTWDHNGRDPCVSCFFVTAAVVAAAVWEVC